jgi:hypothetical protein
MKKLKLGLILMVTILLFSCEKDENGYYIKYYKDRTGTGYIFYKWNNDSIAPIPNLKMEIRAHTQGSDLFPGKDHFDYVYTDKNGKYEFKVVKTIDREYCVSYVIGWVSLPVQNPAHIGVRGCYYAEFFDKKGIAQVDTIFTLIDR